VDGQLEVMAVEAGGPKELIHVGEENWVVHRDRELNVSGVTRTGVVGEGAGGAEGVAVHGPKGGIVETPLVRVVQRVQQHRVGDLLHTQTTNLIRRVEAERDLGDLVAQN